VPIAFLLLLLGSFSSELQSPPAACPGPARVLDFWIGRWSVTNAKGQVVADSVIESVADGCGVLERYTGRPGPAGRRYIGAGLHVFDAGSGAWKQLWSDTRPGVTEMQGRESGGAVIYEWTVVEPGGRIPKRYTLSRQGTGVRQLGERSDDGGAKWTVEFDLRYQNTAQ
jgi:hypothetical protein